MAVKDFNKYVDGLKYTVAEDIEALQDMKIALAKGETDEKMVEAAERALNRDKYRLEILLFAKGLINKRKRRENGKQRNSGKHGADTQQCD